MPAAHYDEAARLALRARDGAIAAPPVVSGGLVIAASLGGKLSAVSFAGAERWSVDLGERVYSGPLLLGDAPTSFR